ADAMRAAGFDDMPGPEHVGAVVALVVAPGTGLRSVVEDRVDAFRRGEYGVSIGKVAVMLGHTHRIELRIVAAVEAGDLVATFAQAAAQGLPEKATTAGHQDLHGRNCRCL